MTNPIDALKGWVSDVLASFKAKVDRDMEKLGLRIQIKVWTETSEAAKARADVLRAQLAALEREV